MNKSWLLPRRTMLKGLGASLALPLLETMGWAETPKAGGYKPPVRMAFIYVPHGVNHDHFWPTEGKLGASSTLPSILEPLRSVINDVLVLGGLDHRAEIDDRGHHASETATWLSGVAAKRDKIEAGISVDQLAAQKIGMYTVLPSMELALHQGKSVGDCDTGYSCAYHSHISWRSPTQPMPRELDPRAVFDRMFQSRKSRPNKSGHGPSVDVKQFASQSSDQSEGPSLDQSMLDLILENAKGLRAKVIGNDRQKLDQYLDGVRELEKRIQALERQAEDQENAKSAKKGYKTSPIIEVKIPAAVSKKFDENAKLMLDLITLAFQSDTTRIATLMFSQAFGRSYPECGVSENHHECSHHGIDAKDVNWNPEKREKVRRINIFHMEQLAYFLQKMKSLNEGNGSLLDNSMVLYGSGMSDGARHNHINLPTLVAGRGGGTITSGRYVKKCSGNFCDLLMGMLARAGCPTDKFGDGTKILSDLS